MEVVIMGTYNKIDLIEGEIADNRDAILAQYEYNEQLPSVQLEHIINTKIDLYKQYKGDPDIDIIRQVIINTNI
jgi:hypothetical protein